MATELIHKAAEKAAELIHKVEDNEDLQELLEILHLPQEDI